MEQKGFSRREFLKKNSLAGAGLTLGMGMTPGSVFNRDFSGADKPAILGGEPLIAKQWQAWPIWNPETDEKRVLEVLRSGVWSRDAVVAEFEEKWAQTMGTKRCLSVVNGTNAMICAIANFDLGAGDEVLVPPYTFIATIQAVLQNGAMPVFVDTDPETFQMDVNKIEQKITPRTRAILPVHVAGLPADMERIMLIAKKHNLLVIEDACQAWMAEVNHKKVGTIGNAGCYSFQNSKNITMGEGGAIVSDDDTFMDKCFSYHSYGNPHGTVVGDVGSGTIRQGSKLRLTEYQAAIGLAQLERLEPQTVTRTVNANRLRSLLADIPGIVPYKLYPNVTRAAFHLFPFRFKKDSFGGLTRDTFIKALQAEGVPCSSGYTPLNKMPFLGTTFRTKNFRKMYPQEMLDEAKYYAANECPENDLLCTEAVWFTQNLLLGEKSDMDLIAGAILKIRKNAGRIYKEAKG
jgi:dTDP-4-amino-4,6-dideoxygalactose transaminase